MSIWDWEGMAKPALVVLLLVPWTPAAVLRQQSGRQAGWLGDATMTGRCCRWCCLRGQQRPLRDPAA